MTDLAGSLQTHGQKQAITAMNRDAYLRAMPPAARHTAVGRAACAGSLFDPVMPLAEFRQATPTRQVSPPTRDCTLAGRASVIS